MKSLPILLAVVPLAVVANGSQPPEMARPPWHHPLLVCQGDRIPHGAVVLARGMGDEDLAEVRRVVSEVAEAEGADARDWESVAAPDCESGGWMAIVFTVGIHHLASIAVCEGPPQVLLPPDGFEIVRRGEPSEICGFRRERDRDGRALAPVAYWTATRIQRTLASRLAGQAAQLEYALEMERANRLTADRALDALIAENTELRRRLAVAQEGRAERHDGQAEQSIVPRSGYRLIRAQVTRMEEVYPQGTGTVTVYLEGANVGALPPECRARHFGGGRVPICSYELKATLWIQNNSDKWLAVGRVSLDGIMFRGSTCGTFHVPPGHKEDWSVSREVYHYSGNPPATVRGHNIGWAPVLLGAPTDRSGRKAC